MLRSCYQFIKKQGIVLGVFFLHRHNNRVIVLYRNLIDIMKPTFQLAYDDVAEMHTSKVPAAGSRTGYLKMNLFC